MARFLFFVTLLLAGGFGFVRADAPASPEDRLAAAQKVADGLHYQQGEITLRNGLAKINLSPNFRYLDPRESKTVLTTLWGNPDPGENLLGMLVPTNAGVVGSDAWAIVISFNEDGYVKDGDAAKINYDELLKKMREDAHKASEARAAKGYAAMELTGWAAPPRYDAAAHKLYWALDFRFGDSAEDTLNYNIRMLGRRGVLVLNAVAGMGQLGEIEKAAPTILSMVDFQEGHRYVDFKPGTDKVATYGLAALITGGVLAKAGIFKGFWALLLAAKKFVLVAIAAIAAAIKKFFGKLTGRGKSTNVPT